MVTVVLGVVLLANAGLIAACVGSIKVARLWNNRSLLTARLGEIAPYLGGITAVILISKLLQDAAARFSRTYGFEATSLFYKIEGDFIAWLQSLFPEVTNLYFGTIYIFGYLCC